ncbi:hypothetical protein Tco_0017137 [Tanacetum coccineum]
MFRVDRTEVRGTMPGEQLQLEMGEFRTELAMLILNGVVLDEEQLLFIAGGQSNTFDDDVDEEPVQDLALNEDNTMFMENLSSADPIYDDVGPSYDSNILYEVQDHDNYLDNVGEYHEVDEMQNDVQPNYAVDSDAEYTSDSNIIPYEQYVKDNAIQVVQSNVSSVPNDALMLIINDMHEQAAQCVSANEHNKVVNESLTAELARYKEQVQIYEKRAMFELTEREQNVDEQMGIIITDLKTNHASVVVHDSKDTLELAEITRKRMLEKVKIPLCVEKKVKIAPPDYSKEKYLATFTPQRHLTPKQIFWSSDIQVEQNDVDKQCADIERKNRLIENKNLIAACLSNELLYSVMNDVNIVSRFSEMHDAYIVEQARCLELEAEISKLKHKIQKVDHSEMIKRFFNLEIDHLNL